MFETTVVESKRHPIGSRRIATLPISIAFHALMLGGAVIANVWTVAFPQSAPHQYALYTVSTPPPPPPPPPPPKRTTAQPPRVRRPIDPREMMAPTVIPDTIPEVLPEPVEAEFTGVDSGVTGGVEGGVEGGEMGGVVGGVASETPKDPSGLLRAEVDLPKPYFTSQVFPEYPEGARLRGIQGVVVIDYIIGIDGRVREVRVLEDPNPSLTKAAVSAIKRWRVKPTIVNGQALEVIHKLSIIFQLD